MLKAMNYLVAILIVLLVAVLFFPVSPWEAENATLVETRNDLARLVNAVRAYRSEYGKYPKTQTPGVVESERENARLVNALCGQDSKLNERGIVFLEVATNSRNGIKSAGDAFVDAWGNYYRVRFDADEDGNVNSPYLEGSHQLRTPVVAWSVGKDGKQGHDENSSLLGGSDDIVSWK